jgi:ATP-dependent helicase/nuclease subunit A
VVHAIVAQLSPSPEQEPAVITRDRDLVVTAGAGTGKTRTLVARYLSLLGEGLPLRSVVAITFTRKAAREMRNRVREEIRRYLATPNLDRHEQGRWQALYRQLDAARIGTIHSLCTEILRAHPAEARIDPRFEVLGEGQMDLLRGQAVDEAMAWAADDEGAVTLFTLLGEGELRASLDALMGDRLDAEEAFSQPPPDLLAHWGRILAQQQEQALATLVGRPEWVDATAILQGSTAHKADDKMELQRQSALAAIQGSTGLLADQLTCLARLSAINLGGGSAKVWPGGKGQLSQVKAALRTLRELWRNQAGLLELTLTPMDEDLAQAMPVLSAAFAYARQRYDNLKRERNVLDFDDLEQGALTLLEGNAAVKERWQGEVGAILVDEFQDTNGRQRDLVKILNGKGGRLFIVGDAKQSIYRFRGADVTVFRNERDRIEREGGAHLPLKTSYRAHRALILGLNDLLRPILGEESDPVRPWVEPFAPLGHNREEPGPGFVLPHIELHLTVGSKGKGALDRAAEALVARIVGLIRGGAKVEEGSRSRPLNYGDVVILCRASTSFSAYEDALERAGVPFLTVAGRGFYGRPEIRDLLNTLRALADPTHDLALAGALRSPALAVSDEALYHLCWQRDQADETASLWQVLKQDIGELLGADGPRAKRAATLISQLNGQVGRTPVADVLKAYLDATDYRAALIRAGQSRGARNVSKLLADAHTSGIVGVGEFLEYIDNLRGSGAREGEARATSEGAVQVMSVHAAKGLEFPIVVIGDVTYGGGRSSRSTLIDPDLGVLLSPKDEEDKLPASYRLGRIRADDQETAESDRLLYVAATRAREKLILNGCVGLKKDGTLSKMGGWLGKLAHPLGLADLTIEHNEDGDGIITLDLQVGETPITCAVYEPGWRWEYPPGEELLDLTQEVTLPPPLLPPVCFGAEQVDGRTWDRDRIPPQRVWRVVPTVKRARAPAWVIGSIVHEALAAWRFPEGGASEEGSHRFEAWARARARSYGLTDHRQLDDASRQSRRLLLRFRAHPLYQEMNDADSRLHEVPYSLVVDGRVESGIIDALVLRNDTWTIVEFKTDRVADRAQLELLLAAEDYVAQAQRYAVAAEHLLGQRPRCILCLLNYAGTVHLETDLAV